MAVEDARRARLTPERWQQIEHACEAALACPVGERDAVLDRECDGDAELRSEVESLLGEQGRAESLLDTSAWEAAAAAFVDAADAPAPRLTAGRRLGPFIIQEPAGAGGMGEVYRATDTRLDRTVAIKVLPPDTAADTESRQRLHLEALAASALAHPHICALFDVGSDEGCEYLVMEYLEGRTLAQRMAATSAEGASRRLPIEEAVAYGVQIADALAAAHRRGIVHCDLKPANVMLTKEGVKLLDFGVARMRPTRFPEPTGAGSPARGGASEGALFGTINYMAPELLAGREPDARTDLFAFGALLFEMLTGRPAFDGSSPAAIAKAILDSAPPPVSESQPLAPRPLVELVGRCLAKDPDERWDSSRLAADLLRGVGDELARPLGPGQRVRRVERRQRWRAWWAPALACTSTSVLLLAAFTWWDGPRKEPAGFQRLDLSLGMNFLVHPRTSPALVSPDGSRIVFSGEGPSGGRYLYVRKFGQADPVLIEGTAGHLYPFFSPDGRSVAFFAEKGLYKVSVAGGAPVPLCDAALQAVRGGSWGDDGTIVAALGPVGGLSRIPSSGGAPSVLTRLDPARHDVTHRWPQMLPGSRAVLFTAHTMAGRYDDASIEVQWLETGERRTLHRGGYFGRYLASGHLVFVRHNTLFAAPMDLGRLALTGPPVAVVNDVIGDADIGRLEFTVSDTGTALCPTGTWQPPHHSAAWRDALGRQEALPVVPGAYGDPRVSPRGDRIALTVGEGTLTRRQVAILDLTRREPLKLLSDSHDLTPLWAPDGEHVVFGSDGNRGAHNLYWRRADGAGPVVRLTTSSHMQVASSFTPDGRRLAFVDLDPETGWDIWTLPLDLRDPDRPVPGAPEPLLRTPLNERNPAYSPDGRWLAYVGSEGDRSEVYVRPAAAGARTQWQVSHGGGLNPLWPNGRQELVYETMNRSVARVDFVMRGDQFVVGPPRLWRGVHLVAGEVSYSIRDFDLSPDGRRLLMLDDPHPASSPPPASITLLLDFFDELHRRAPAAR